MTPVTLRFVLQYISCKQFENQFTKYDISKSILEVENAWENG